MSATRLTSALFIATFIAGCVDEDVGRDRDNDGFQTWELGGEDCDDTNANVNPSQSELCGNGIDDDCDGFIDNEGVGETDWYLDEDADGFTQPDPVISCARPDGALADASSRIDCDDTSDAIYPGAPEVWYDGIDQACDGGNDFDADGDGYNGIDGGGDDCDDSEVGVNPGSVELCGNGLDDDCDGTPNQCEWRGELVVEDIATAMFPVESERQWYRDLTGDGVEDVLLVTFPNRDGEREWSLYAGPFDAETPPIRLTSWTTSSGTTHFTHVEQALLEADINADGIADLVVPKARPFEQGFDVYLSPHQNRVNGTPDLSLQTMVSGANTAPLIVAAVDDLDNDGADELLWASTSLTLPSTYSLQLVSSQEVMGETSSNLVSIDQNWRPVYVPPRVSLGAAFPLIGIEAGAVGGSHSASDDVAHRMSGTLEALPDALTISIDETIQASSTGALETSRSWTTAHWDFDQDGASDSFVPSLLLGRWSNPSEEYSGLAILEDDTELLRPTTPQPPSAPNGAELGDIWQWGATACDWFVGSTPEVLEFREEVVQLPFRFGNSSVRVTTRSSLAGAAVTAATLKNTLSTSCHNTSGAIFASTTNGETALIFPVGI